ncbi:MAG: P-type conjugative transfer protein TrbJ [Acidithiobacillus sp.]|nr:P-type conjugative transfer protein TrbJ [Acidithiobacillus sp.]
MKKLLIAIATSAALGIAPAAFAGGGLTGGATLPEQIAQEVTLGDQLAKQAEQLQEQIQMVVNQLKNLQSLGQGFNQQVFGQLTGDIKQLMGVFNQANALSYAGQNIGTQLAQEYPGAGTAVDNMQKYFQEWNDTTNTDVQDAIQAQGLEVSQFESQDQAMQYIEQKAQTATGRLEVEQAAVAASNITTKAIHSMGQELAAVQDEKIAYEKQKKAENDATIKAVQQSLFGGFNNTIY